MLFPPSLVKYSTPVLISTGVRKKGKSRGKKTKTTKYYDVKDSKIDKSVDIWKWIRDMEDGQTIEEILNAILIPREHHMESQGQVWIQTSLSVPATRSDVVQLQDELKKRLTQRQANETGICPVREELFNQCFDELIRQVIISYKKRGLLLACVRDQINLTINCYKNLYESSIAFGIRKAVHADKYKGEMKEEIETLESDCSQLQGEVNQLKETIEQVRKNQEQKRKEIRDHHEEEIKRLMSENSKIKFELERKLSSNPKIKKKRG